MTSPANRRDFLGKGLLGAAAAGAAYSVQSLEEKILLAALEEGQAQSPPQPAAGEEMPRGKIGNIQISRLLIGGNLIGGWAHARDLIYVSALFKAYNTEAKVFDTLELAERSGINTIQIDPLCQDVVEKYKRQRGSKLQTMICINPDRDWTKMADQIKRLMDRGATLLYTHGEGTDRQVMAGRLDVLAKALELIRAQGVPAGIGSHSLETPIACEKENLNPDYYVKTFHLDRYWSATPPEHREEWCWYKGHSLDHNKYHDNIFCLDADKTAAFFEAVKRPWVAFKVLAAGAIHPQIGLSSAYRHGADFVILGMFDFQIAQDVAIAKDCIRKHANRKRPWYG